MPFEREELFPTVTVTGVPRVGTVHAELSADRYVASYGDNDYRFGDWRIVLRDVRTPPEEGSTYGKLAVGVGPATRAKIRETAEPIVAAWLASSAYPRARRKAVAYTIRRAISDAGVKSYRLESVRETLDKVAPELAPLELSALKNALELAAQAAAILDREPIG